MTEPDDAFVERVMTGVARRERRMPLLLAALALSALVLAAPAAIALRAHTGLAVGVEFAEIGTRAVVKAVSDNPVFWSAVVAALAWTAWLVARALGGRP